MRRPILSFYLSLCLVFALISRAEAETPAPARTIMDTASKQASASGKNVFLIFHATWCSWCKRLDAALIDPEVKQIMEANYVITHLDVLERGEKILTAENPGGKEILNQLGGEKSGLPFYAILDPAGKKLADSNVMPGNSNIGFPGSPEEIAAFDKILKQTAPRMTEEQRAAVTKHLGVKQ
jgi:thiol:disulfide interchange protein